MLKMHCCGINCDREEVHNEKRRRKINMEIEKQIQKDKQVNKSLQYNKSVPF